MNLAYNFVILVGLGMIAISPMLAKDPDVKAWHGTRRCRLVARCTSPNEESSMTDWKSKLGFVLTFLVAGVLEMNRMSDWSRTAARAASACCTTAQRSRRATASQPGDSIPVVPAQGLSDGRSGISADALLARGRGAWNRFGTGEEARPTENRRLQSRLSLRRCFAAVSRQPALELGRADSNWSIISSAPTASIQKRIYVTGLSMGGYGTWALCAANPGRFAAAVPICGGGKTADADKLKSLPLWVFHGAKDGIVTVQQSEEMVQAIEAAGGKVKFTIYPEAATIPGPKRTTIRPSTIGCWSKNSRNPPHA